jgi:hypothetical protein
MVVMLALRLLFPHTTLELVLNCDLNLNFQLIIIFFYQVNSMVSTTNINNIKSF